MASEHQQFAPPVEGVGRRQEMGERGPSATASGVRGCRWSAAGWPGSASDSVVDPTAWLPASQVRGQDWGAERWLSEKSLKGNSCIRAEGGEGEEERKGTFFSLPTTSLPHLSLLFCSRQFTTSILSKMVFLVTKVNFMAS